MNTKALHIPAVDQWRSRHNRAFAYFLQHGPMGLLRKIREAGPRRAIAAVARQIRHSVCIFFSRRWDRKNQVDTSGQIPLASLDVVGPNRNLGHCAVSTSPQMFEFLSDYFPSEKGAFAYLDMGCGKGRTLLMASTMGFGYVIGVEFARQLCDVARTNISSWKNRGKRPDPCFVIEADITEYALPKENLVLYFGNPLYPELWPAMIANIVRSYRECPRKMHIVLAGSAMPETIRLADSQLAATGIFRQVASGVSPYFIDTYLPYHYEVFETSLENLLPARSRG